MPLILVVEQEKRYVERIQEALSPQGWEVIGVDSRAGVMRLVADRAADLMIVNAEVNEAEELVASFSRAAGGPGTVALVPEAGDNGEIRASADEVLEKPFTDQDIRLAVRRCVSAGSKAPAEAVPAALPPSGERLSSEELFGDVVLELEDAFAAGAAAVDAGAAAPTGEQGAEEPEIVVEAEAEIDEALSGIAAEEPAKEELEIEEEEELGAEAPVEEEPVAEERIEEEPIEAEPVSHEPEVEEPELAAEDEVEEPQEVVEAEELEEVERLAAEVAVEEAPAHETESDFVEEPAAGEAEEEELEELEVPEEETPADEEEIETAEPARPAKFDLEDRLRQAMLAGKAAAAAREPAPAPERDSGEAADLLLQKALGTLSWGAGAKPEIDQEFAEPAHATDEEVDELVGTVVGKRKVEAREEEADGTSEADESPGLDVIEAELLERDESEYRDRMKLVWAIIIIALLALLAFFVTRSLNDEAPVEEPPAASTPAPEPQASEAEGALDAEGTDEPGGVNDEATGDGGSYGDAGEENGGGA